MSRRGWCAAAIGIALLTVGFAAPAGAAETTFDDTCADVYGHRAVGDLEKTTDPAAGNTVMSGQTVGVTLELADVRRGRRTGPPGDRVPQHRRRHTPPVGRAAVHLRQRHGHPVGRGARRSVIEEHGLRPELPQDQGLLRPGLPVEREDVLPRRQGETFPALAPGARPTRNRRRPQPENRSTSTTRAPLFSRRRSRRPGRYRPHRRAAITRRRGRHGRRPRGERLRLAPVASTTTTVPAADEAPQGPGHPVGAAPAADPDPGAEPDAAPDGRRRRRPARRGRRRPVLGPDAAADRVPHRGQPAGRRGARRRRGIRRWSSAVAGRSRAKASSRSVPYVRIRRNSGFVSWKPFSDAGGTQKAARATRGPRSHVRRTVGATGGVRRAVSTASSLLAPQCARIAESGGGTQP